MGRMGRRKLVAVPVEHEDGPIEIHFPSVYSDYLTLCGEGGHGEEPTPLPRGARVNCAHCLAIYAAMRTVPKSLIGEEGK